MTWRFRFMARRRLFLGLSALLLLITIVSLATRGLNFGIDFQGGVVLDITTPQATSVAEIRSVLAQQNLGDAQIQELGGDPRKYEIRTLPITDEQRQQVLAALRAKFGQATTQDNLDEVSPTIGRELRVRAILAVLLATALMTAYLAVRFQLGEGGLQTGLHFAVAAVVALLHDITLTVGLFSVFHLQVNSPFVAAVLTVYGYSMNDTIIVFDRIRERLQLRRQEPLEQAIDVSLNQVFNRTLTTVATVILALVAVIALGGGGGMRELAVALLVGVGFGTYSSVFIASPVLLFLATRSGSRARAAGARAARGPRGAGARA
jgi:preprotein translocase subunit SecF